MLFFFFILNQQFFFLFKKIALSLRYAYFYIKSNHYVIHKLHNNYINIFIKKHLKIMPEHRILDCICVIIGNVVNLLNNIKKLRVTKKSIENIDKALTKNYISETFLKTQLNNSIIKLWIHSTSNKHFKNYRSYINFISIYVLLKVIKLYLYYCLPISFLLEFT